MSLSVLPLEIIYIIVHELVEDPKTLIKFGETCELIHAITNDILNRKFSVEENGQKVEKPLFGRLIELYKEEVGAKNRLTELRGPNRFDGLVNEAYWRKENAHKLYNQMSLRLDNAKKSDNEAWQSNAEALTLYLSSSEQARKDPSQRCYELECFEKSMQAAKKRLQTDDEKKQLTRQAGVLRDQWVQIASEYKALKDEFATLARFEGTKIIGGKVHDLPIKIKTEIKRIQDKLNEKSY